MIAPSAGSGTAGRVLAAPELARMYRGSWRQPGSRPRMARCTRRRRRRRRRRTVRAADSPVSSGLSWWVCRGRPEEAVGADDDAVAERRVFGAWCRVRLASGVWALGVQDMRDRFVPAVSVLPMDVGRTGRTRLTRRRISSYMCSIRCGTTGSSCHSDSRDAGVLAPVPGASVRELGPACRIGAASCTIRDIPFM